MAYILDVLTLTLLYGAMAVSLDLLVGQTGMLSLAHAGCFAIGAYLAAILSVHGMLPFPLALGVSVAAAAAFGGGIALVSKRLRGDMFVLATLGFQALVWSVLNNWVAVTQGPMGISGIPRPTIFG